MIICRLLEIHNPIELQSLRSSGSLVVSPVSGSDFTTAIINTRPSVDMSTISRFRKWDSEFGSR